MTTNPLPDLSKWHEVPTYADIPADTPYAWQDADGTWGASDGLAGSRYVASARATGTRYFTAEPIPAPRPTPPTEPGTVLVDVTDGRDTCAVMFYHGGEWHGTDQDGDERFWQTPELVSWTVADVVPRKAAPDPLDENDHRDRVDSGGDRWTRRETAGWMDGHWSIENPTGARTLRSIENDFGPVRFADEVQS